MIKLQSCPNFNFGHFYLTSQFIFFEFELVSVSILIVLLTIYMYTECK